MHTYRKSEEHVWTVGYYAPTPKCMTFQNYAWTPIKDFSTEESAAAYTSYLNGGRWAQG